MAVKGRLKLPNWHVAVMQQHDFAISNRNSKETISLSVSHATKECPKVNGMQGWETSPERSVREHNFELPPNGVMLRSSSTICLHFGFKCGKATHRRVAATSLWKQIGIAM